MERPVIETLDHVQVAIPVGSEDRARSFYCDLLGLAEIDKPEALSIRGGLWLKLGDRELHLGTQEPFVAATKAHPAFRASDLDGFAELLSGAGYPLKWDDHVSGVRRFETADPFGNRLEFLTRKT